MSLALRYEDLAGEVGHFLGYGRGAAFDDPAWPAMEAKTIDRCVQTGYGWFIRTPEMQGEKASYPWSFLSPVGTATTVSGNAEVLLPIGFGGLNGSVVVEEGGLMTRSSEIAIHRLHAADTNASGIPVMFALTTDKDNATHDQRMKFYVFPTPDDAYTLTFNYYFMPQALSNPRPFAVGGPEHHETLKAACIAAAEVEQNHEMGIRYKMFLDRLKASIAFDRDHRKPTNLGYNGDRSDIRNLGRIRNHDRPFTVTIDRT